MNEIKLNETPKRTAENFNINNIKINDIELPKNIEKLKFEKVKVNNTSSAIKLENNVDDFKLKYGVGNVIDDIVIKNSNCPFKITIEERQNKKIEIEFSLDEQNKKLLDNIEIIANENSKATIIIKYATTEQIDNSAFHSGILRLIARENSHINIIIVNLISENINNFMSIQNEFEKNATVNYTIIDFGGKNSITNYYSNLQKNSKNVVNTIYLGKDEQLFDLNYIAELYGKKSQINIDVQGALAGNSKKHFKGTIDFKKGSKKSKGNENEYCMLLSNSAKSIALPMLLCAEEDVEGNHSSSSGRVGEKELFYIMSRGFTLKEAMKLMVKANFNKTLQILETLENEKLVNEVITCIDERLN